MARVVCTSNHVINLSDGRQLAPGESSVDDVDLNNEHNNQLVLDGQVYELPTEKTSATARPTTDKPGGMI